MITTRILPSFSRLIIAVMLGIVLVFFITSCGKRGDPYRPSETSFAASIITP